MSSSDPISPGVFDSIYRVDVMILMYGQILLLDTFTFY